MANSNSENPGVGSRFESLVQRFFARNGLALERAFRIDIGMSRLRRPRRYDLGSEEPPVLVECKCHVWTEGRNAPSAKLAAWTEAMHYFAAAPRRYRRILAVLRDERGDETLGQHYIKRFEHLIPRGVEIWEIAPSGRSGCQLYPGGHS